MSADSRPIFAARMLAVALPPVKSGWEPVMAKLVVYGDAKILVSGLDAFDELSLPPLLPLLPLLDFLEMA